MEGGAAKGADPKPARTKEEALKTVIEFYRSGDVKGFSTIASSPGKSFAWVAKDPNNKEQVTQMKEFGEFLAKTKPVWFTAENRKREVAQFGPVTKAWHFHLVRKNDFWYLDETIGGD